VGVVGDLFVSTVAEPPVDMIVTLTDVTHDLSGIADGRHSFWLWCGGLPLVHAVRLLLLLALSMTRTRLTQTRSIEAGNIFNNRRREVVYVAAYS
jgi:hypothetical protein